MKNPRQKASSKKTKKAKIDCHLQKMTDQFNRKFPTDADCLRELWRRTYQSDVARCHFCLELQPDFQFDKRTFDCEGCHKKNSVTAGTFFENIRRPRPWLARIWFFEKGVIVSSSQFSQLFDIVYSTSLNIFKKVTMAVADQLPALTDHPSSDFESVICRRSAETPANEHPRSELQFSEQQNSQATSELDQGDLVVLEMLKGDGQLSTDQLLKRSGFSSGQLALSLVNLTYVGLVKSLPGDLYAPVQPFENRKIVVSSKVAAFIDFIRRTFQGISRKYLQLYLCGYWIYFDKNRWRQGALLEACGRAAEITDAQVRAYISPMFVRVA